MTTAKNKSTEKKPVTKATKKLPQETRFEAIECALDGIVTILDREVDRTIEIGGELNDLRSLFVWNGRLAITSVILAAIAVIICIIK
jgi:hypothetical protein